MAPKTTKKKPTQPKAPAKQSSKGNDDAESHEEGKNETQESSAETKETTEETTQEVVEPTKELTEEELRTQARLIADEKAEGKKIVDRVLDSKEQGTKPTTEKELLDPIEYPDATHDMSAEKEKPTPNKKTIELEGGGKTTETKWECPKCTSPCHRLDAQKWRCMNNNCDYGKPKPLAEVPKEITRYKVTIPQLGIGVQNVKMVHVGGNEYVIAEGQEEYIAKQALRKLKNKQLKKMNRPQIEYMLKHGAFDEPKKR